MSDFITLLKWRAQQALNTSLSVGGVGACMHGCMSGVTPVWLSSPVFMPDVITSSHEY